MKQLAVTVTIVLGILLCACNVESIPVFVTWAADGSPDELLEGTGDVLGYPLVEVDEKYGALWLSIHGVEDGWDIHGETLDDNSCKRAAWVHPDPQEVAHEIGHMLGLDHTTAKGNLMRDRSHQGTELTDKQIRKLERSLGRLNACVL